MPHPENMVGVAVLFSLLLFICVAFSIGFVKLRHMHLSVLKLASQTILLKSGKLPAVTVLTPSLEKVATWVEDHWSQC